MPITTVGIVSAVTPSVIETYISHYLNRGQLRQKPTAHISYHEGLRLLRQFLEYSSKHTVEDLQAFTAQWVPAPTWVKTENVNVGVEYLNRAAKLIQAQLGPKGLEQVGGSEWWQWRRSESPLRAEWIEMRKDFVARKQHGGKLERAMLYVHGGAYFFGAVDEHRYQIQRHARKLKIRVLAPRYRLAPQFPFPCGLQDAIACYLYLLQFLQPSQILVSGDSAGGGMILSMLVILRDQGIPLPAGAMLLSPWVDLTHSFPSVAGEGKDDYIPAHGFHHKPSLVWPPPNAEDLANLKAELGNDEKIATDDAADLTLTLDGQEVRIKDQIQMYATNSLLAHPLVSPVQQPSLGGLPPLLIQVGGGELLHDEQVYLAHKAADPQRYRPTNQVMEQFGLNKDDITKYDPTYVQLQVWEDLCHVPHTLSFTRPAKYMFRSVAQFGAWALAHAQQKDVEIDDDANSIISSGADTDIDADASSSTVDLSKSKKRPRTATQPRKRPNGAVGKAGDPLPPFKDHMIRQKVDRHGITYPLAAAADLPCLHLEPRSIGAIKPGPVRKWLAKKQEMDTKYASEKRKVQKKRLKEMAAGYERFPTGDRPPPTALAGRRRHDMPVEKKAKKSWALALWSGWGAHHDEETLERAEEAEQVEIRPSSRETDISAATEPQSRPDLLSPGKSTRRASSNSGVSTESDLRPRSRRVTDAGQANESRARIHTTSPSGSSEPPKMANIAPESTKVEGSDNTFTAPNSARPHNGISAYPFKLRNPMSTASTATLDDSSSVVDTNTQRSTPAQSVAPAESLVAEKEAIMPYYHEKEVVVTPYQPVELATSSRSPATRAPDAYAPSSPQGHASKASLATSPVETYRPREDNRVRNPAFDQTGAAMSKFTTTDTQAGPPKPVGFAYNPRDLRNAMINRQAAETAAPPVFTPPVRQQTFPVTPAGYVAPVELPAMAHDDTETLLARRPSALTLNPESEPVELSTIKQTRLSMLPSPRTEPPPTPTLELSVTKQTRNSVLPVIGNEAERPESPTLRPSTMASNDSSTASVTSSNAPAETMKTITLPVEQQRPIPAPLKAVRALDNESLPPTPPPKDVRFTKNSPDIGSASGHTRVASKPPVLREVSLGSGLGLSDHVEKMSNGL